MIFRTPTVILVIVKHKSFARQLDNYPMVKRSASSKTKFLCNSLTTIHTMCTSVILYIMWETLHFTVMTYLSTTIKQNRLTTYQPTEIG